EHLDPSDWLPAVGQGALAVVARADDEPLLQRLRGLDHAATAAATTAERAFLRALEGGCQVPIGALGRVEGDRVVLHGLVAELDGGRILRVEESGPLDEADALGRRAADALLALGAGGILTGIRDALAPQAAAP
ncbi:MAG TPA: hypothetical protein VK358_06500, partial [Longimicrobium sp.]|nr:hypothetical protein [Longimicrobium sp.]